MERPSINDFVDFENWNDYYQKGFDNKVYGFTYFPDMTSQNEVISYCNGYRDGEKFKEAFNLYIQQKN